jgi:hypothetical protein
MFTKIVNNLLVVSCFFACQIEAKTVHAKSFDVAIHKIYKRNFHEPEFDYVAFQRDFMLLGKEYWFDDNLDSDTIYVCDVMCSFDSSFNEYIITPRRIYSLENKFGKSLICKVFSNLEEINGIDDIRFIDYVRNWDVDLFKRWNDTRINDCTCVNAIRIIRLSSHKYRYELYTFFDNYYEENDPLQLRIPWPNH